MPFLQTVLKALLRSRKTPGKRPCHVNSMLRFKQIKVNRHAKYLISKLDDVEDVYACGKLQKGA